MALFRLFRKRRVVVNRKADWLASLSAEQREQLARNLREIVAYKDVTYGETVIRDAPRRRSDSR